MKLTRFFLSLVLLGALVLSFNSCVNDDEEGYDYYGQLAKDVDAIDKHLTAAGITDVVKDSRGLRMVITELGTGVPAMPTSRVKVGYVGKLLSDGSTFDQGTVQNNPLRSYIDGWIVALMTLPEGSKAKLYIPSPLGYGATPQTKIPANSNLVFDIDFQAVDKTEIEKQQFKTDTTAIENYITTKALTDVEKLPSGVRYKITEVGSGPKPTWYSVVKMNLKYRLLSNDANVVHSQTVQPGAGFDSRVVDVINGLKVGLQEMNEGGKATFYVPSGLAYGTEAVSSGGTQIFPANANLIIEVELTDVE